jgi:hypothetical protein
MPPLTLHSLWIVGHNGNHGYYTNPADFDFVWQPVARKPIGCPFMALV